MPTEPRFDRSQIAVQSDVVHGPTRAGSILDRSGSVSGATRDLPGGVPPRARAGGIWSGACSARNREARDPNGHVRGRLEASRAVVAAAKQGRARIEHGYAVIGGA